MSTFFNTDSSQSSVATYLRCGGIFKDNFTINSLVSLSVKDLENVIIL